MQHHAAAGPRCIASSIAREQRATVGHPGQLVVQCLVRAFFGDDVQPLDGAGLVQRHGRVGRHRLEDVLVGRR